jgi:uncharacterized protein YigA (DUF484 family)
MVQETQSTSELPDDVDGDMTSQSVAAYLIRHPDFLTDHPELMKALTPPSRWNGDAVVDLQSYMVDMLKTELEGLRNCAQEVIETSRSNMTNQTRTHAAVLALIAASDLERLMRIITDDLPVLLDVDVAVVGLEGFLMTNGGDAEIRKLAAGDVDRLMKSNQEAVLFSSITDDGSIFAHAGSLVRSAALARLQLEPLQVEGFLALGSRNEAAFRGGQGTELLRFLARVIERCLLRIVTTQT